MKFYRNLFAVLCFAFFLAGITTNSPFAFLVAMLSGALSRTAAKKGWPDPW
ncbi:hypothetical protein [Desulfofustis limnaeus]|uniref:hypothetical protein n=1 Tax=Desulfofustis limnaeus TaxID=2740163 RepID=UPI0024E0189D|nr:hypothetical protein [Desulfofustis limnaeus]